MKFSQHIYTIKAVIRTKPSVLFHSKNLLNASLSSLRPLADCRSRRVKNKIRFFEQVLQLTNHLHLDGDDFGGLRVDTVGRVEDISNVQVSIL